MNAKKTAGKKTSAGAEYRPVALTVKIDGKTYERLSLLKARQRRTHQDILEQALREYLQRERV